MTAKPVWHKMVSLPSETWAPWSLIRTEPTAVQPPGPVAVTV